MGMFGGLARKTPFGQIPMPPGYMGGQGIGDGMIERQQMGMGAMQPDMGSMKRTPFFQRSGVKQGIGMLGDTLSILGGGQASYAPQMMRQQEQDAEIRARIEAEQRQRQAGRENFIFEQDYKRQNPVAPQPTEFERILQASGLPIEQQTILMQDYARNRANPVQGVPYTDEQGNSGLQFIRPGQMHGAGQSAPPRPVGKLRPLGGQPGGNGPFVQ